MKLKLLLFVLLISGGMLQAQDTIRTLLITECFLGNSSLAYFEITNVGDETIQLGDFKFGEMRPWGSEPWEHDATRAFMLPEFELEAGASYVMACAREFGARQFAKGLDGWGEKSMKDEFWTLADMLVHVAETGGDETDSVTTWGAPMFSDIYSGRSCFFLEQHLSETDSVVIDQVNGWFDGDNGLNIDAGGYDIAGVTQASANSHLIRKASVKTGNLNFKDAAGIGEDDGEWIVVSSEGGVWRDVFWSVKNHGDYKLTENTLVSDIADVDFANKTITVPFGTRRGDGIMHLMEKKPGIAWVYHVSPVYADSLTFAAKTGDQLEIIVCGNEGYKATFDIIAADPTADATAVVPMSTEDARGNWRDDNANGQLWSPRVTMNESGIDTIWGARGGIGFAMRIDTLMSRLEIPANATWDMEYVDGLDVRADVKDGDKLVITAEDGTVKKYHISVLPWRKGADADLLAITWPELPEFYYGIFGWTGDTIPGFGPTVYNYRVQVPLEADGNPALVAKTSNTNAKVAVKRATNLSGTVEDRTVEFTVTAEDDTTIRTYSVEMVKELNPVNVQPYFAEPFMSEYVFWEQWSNSFMEVCNPGNQPLDLSNYMITMGYYFTPADIIESNAAPENWIDRYRKYIPGYKWVDEATWQVNPGTVVQDLGVNPIVLPGDVFCLGALYTDGQTWPWQYVWPIPSQLDVNFTNFYGGNYTVLNPWGEDVGATPMRDWNGSNLYIFKILNDSIKQGLKPATDPNDFELIENFGMGEDATWVIGGETSQMITNYIRKPDIYEGNPEFKGSFGTNLDDTEWTWTNEAYWSAQGVGWSQNILYVGHDIGKHFMNTPTHYKSTVSSVVYIATPGYSMNEQIKGIVTGTTVANFLDNVIKADANQVLKVKAAADGSELPMDGIISDTDMLEVMSADSTNTSKYVLVVTAGGLSSDAVLTSTKWDIEIQTDPKSAGDDDNAGTGTITGFEYGTTLKTVIANITSPVGASLDMIDGEGAYVPLKRMNFDTTYVNVTVNNDTYFNVVAENGITTIKYKLVPVAAADAVFITSDIYSVIQKDILIQYVPRGTNVGSFLANLVPAAGATMTLVDKNGLERVDGYVADDDKIIVINGANSKVYMIAMLAEMYVPDITYLAYITSNSYDVEQVDYKVNGVSGTTTIADFYSKINPSMGATAVVVDKDGIEKTTGDIDGSDMVKVTSADGKIVVMYKFGQLVSSGTLEISNIELYPNPTNGILNISGVEKGNRIQIYNATGAAIRNINVQSSLETVSLNGEPSGMYLIVISDQDEVLGRYKAIKK